MALDQESASYLKLVKLYEAMRTSNTKRILEILKQEGDINYKVPNAGLMKLQGWKSVGNTILHLSYHNCSYEENMQYFNLLLDHGADITIKNPKGRTVIHEAFAKISQIYWFTDLRQDLCVGPVLSAHLRFNITANPVDHNGLSHFHAACMINNVEVIEFFLNNGVSIDQRVNEDSPIFAGYTPLHFAAKFVCPEAVELLLRRGADAQAQDAEKMTPLHAILTKSVEVSEWLCYRKTADRKIDDCVDVIKRIAESTTSINVRDHLGFSHLHVLCTFKDSTMLERHLHDNIEGVNRAVNVDSPFCPGFTPLHFAALFNLDSVKLLLAKGADITIKNAKEKTPVDLCIARYGIREVHDIIARSTCKDITLSDGKTKLANLVGSLQNSYGVVKSYIPIDSPLWPGYSPLHVAIIFLEIYRNDSEKKEPLQNLIKRYLKSGTDVCDKGILDQTPLQFAFRHDQVKVVELMLEHHREFSDVVDAEGLSHLHIACAAKKKAFVSILLSFGADVNSRLGCNAKWYVTRERGMITSTSRVFFCAGSTPLHIAVATKNLEMVKLLLQRGADPQAQDANGMSPVHRLMTSPDNREVCAELLSSENLRECVVESSGLSHLHVACYMGHSIAVRRLLLEPEVQVDRVIGCKRTTSGLMPSYGDPSVDPRSVLLPFNGVTPLRMVLRQYNNREIVELLLRHGADILAGGATSSVPLYDGMSQKNSDWRVFVAKIRSDEKLRRRVDEGVPGLTDLHLACYERDLKLIDELVAKGAHVNARIRDDSPFWSGFTPLHVLMRCGVAGGDKLDEVLKFLLVKGADVSISDGRYTPLHLTDPDRFCSLRARHERYLNRISEGPCSEYNRRMVLPAISVPFRRAKWMLKSIQDFTSNPTNDQGVSHFHIACACFDVAAVEAFLKHGVDVNARVDYFSKVFGGYTPLHVTLTRDASSPRKRKIVKLLLNHGADVRAESYSGNTPLHYAAMYYKCVGQKIFEMILDAGADIMAKNVSGESPLGILASHGYATFSRMSYFMKHNCRINDFNPVTDEGLMAMIIKSLRSSEKEKIEKLLCSFPNIGGVDELGRSAIHNVVSTGSSWNLENNYTDLIEKLERLGCDVDHQDNSGQTALHVAARFQNDSAISVLLDAGADVNITDTTGKTAFAYSLIPRKVFDCDRHDFVDIFNEDAIKTFANHAHKLRLAGLHVSVLNENSDRIAHKQHWSHIGVMMEWRRFRTILGSVDNVKAGSKSLTLRDFVSENGAVWKYSKLRRMDREHVLELFDWILNGISDGKLGELKCLVRLQYRNYLARSRLVEAAKVALTNMLNMPDLCSEIILKYLENWELRNVILAES